MPFQVDILIAVATVMFFVIGGLSLLAHYYTLSGIKFKKIGGSVTSLVDTGDIH